MANIDSTNPFRIKGKAHAVSQRETTLASDRWNPFRHIWAKGHKHSQTWDVEAQRPRDVDGEDDSSPIGHIQTAPTGSNRDLSSEGANGKEHKDGSQARRIDRDPSTGKSSEEELVIKENLKKEHRLFRKVQPKEPFTVANQLQRTMLNSWINVLLLAAPVGIVLGAVPDMNQYAIFVVNFVAIIPLAAMLSFATEEITLRTGETLGGLLNASFGNAVELIVAIIALAKSEIVIVQTSLIGSILSNLLLVMGMCFFFGGLRRQEQFFNITVAQTSASLLALAIASIIIPTVFNQQTNLSDSYTAQLSRGTAVILLVVYAAYLYFQLKTHHGVFSQESQKVPMRPSKNPLGANAVKHSMVSPPAMLPLPGHNKEGASNSEELRRVVNEEPFESEGEGDDPQLSFPVAMGTLVGSTVLIAFCAEFLVHSIHYVTTSGGISQEFLGLILLPVVGNAAEHATAVTVAIKDKMDLAIGVAVGSSMQVGLFIIPLLVVISWGMGLDDMNLSFDIFQVTILFVSILLVNYLIGDGKSHWLERMLLMYLYLMIAICAWFYPV